MRSVALVIESLGGGGAQQVAATLCNAWIQKGRRVALISMQAASSDVFHLSPSVVRHVIGGHGASRGMAGAVLANLRRILALRRAIRDSGADVVIGMVGTTNILTVIACMGLGRRVIISERNDPARQSLGRLWDILRRLTYPKADMVTANSVGALAAMRSYVSEFRLKWLPNPVRQDPGREAQRLQLNTILAAGRLNKQKGFDILIDGFAKFSRLHPGWQLVILGEGEERAALEAAVRRLDIENLVALPGYQADPFPWYRAAQIFVQPSRYEGLPNTVLEAMSCGLPCIVTDAQHGLENILLAGRNGIVIPSEQAEALSSAMVQLAGNAGLRAEMGEQAQRAVSDFRTDAVLQAWSAVVDDEE